MYYDSGELIYLDHAATTPLDPNVLDAMLPYFGGSFGNPSSIHRLGREARAAIDAARDLVAELIGADYGEIYFTGSGTEADNLAVQGAIRGARPGRDHIVTSAIEHHAVLHCAHALEAQGISVTRVTPDSSGIVQPESVAEALTERTAMVSIMQANNEIGTLQPVSEIAKLARSAGALMHVDAVQSVGQIPVDVKQLDCDLLTLSGHKIYGPKGVGALYILSGVPITPIIHGGSQEREKRAGTENTAAIVGMGVAARIARQHIASDSAPLIAEMRDSFLAALRNEVPELLLNGDEIRRLPGNVNVSVPGVEGATMLMNLDRCGIAASSGSACSSGSIEPSHVLRAIGLPDTLASSGIRFTLGRSTTTEQLNRAAAQFGAIVRRMRGA